MKHAVKIFNYLKGTYEVAVFDEKSDATKCFEVMKAVEEEDDDLALAVNQAALKKCIAYEDDLPARDICSAKKLENFPYYVNEDGMCRIQESNITFVGNGLSIIVSA